MGRSSERAYSDSLRAFLVSRGIRHRFIEFDGSVKTVEEAAKKIPAKKIAKSIVLVGSNQKPGGLGILPARSGSATRRSRIYLESKTYVSPIPPEVLEYSGYPAGGIPPFNNIQRMIIDPEVLQNAKSSGEGVIQTNY